MKKFQRQLQHPSGFFGRTLLPRLWNRWNQELHKVAFQALDVQPSDRVLEIGFGGGSLLKRVYPIIHTGIMVGVDHSLAVCQHCSKQFKNPLQSGQMGLGQSRAETLPFVRESFDTVYSVNSVFFWSDIPVAFQEIARVLKQSGKHVVVFTDSKSLKEHSALRDAFNPVMPSEISEMLSNSGFVVTQVTEHGDRYRQFHCVISQKR
ncbi:methyltransferase domain-containing protein [candidate division KSB1 bacterium]|nr:methyltransferase domain-containing protein [candidate division KSB1 bacterium]